ncbi:MAG: hypothetical protein CVV39_02600 [Planctomycetes bacterium HGW-Planctomycetes-1]|nr:MAG: hypothetical protein CVV39_02600 [Planctomycetes bacterium HGW-Planctomycetes-1]
MSVNKKISPQGPIEHEGSAIINFQNEKIILEQHESGPELIAFLISLSANFVHDFAKWLFLNSVSAFQKKGATKIKLTRKIITTKRKTVDESTLEVDVKNITGVDKVISDFLK